MASLPDSSSTLRSGSCSARSPSRRRTASTRRCRDAIAECLATGLTAVHEMGATLFALASYRRLIERGTFPFRNYAAVAGRSEETWSDYRERGPEVIGDAQVMVRAFKVLSDGALGSRGAALHSPYCDDPENRGLLLIPPDELARLTGEALDRGFQVCVHAIGDRANTLTLDTLEQMLAARPEARALRPRVEHAQILAGADILASARWACCRACRRRTARRTCRGRRSVSGRSGSRGAYAWRSLLDNGGSSRAAWTSRWRARTPSTASMRP